jgi:peroxiredoxin
MKVESRMTGRTTRGRRVGLALAMSLVLACAPARAQHDQENPPLPVAGDVIAAFDAESVDGPVKKVAFEGKGSTVLLFFLSSCPTCHKMLPEWNRAYQRRAKNVNVVGVLLDHAPAGFFEAYPVAFPVVQSPGRDFLQTYKVTRTPTTLRVAAGGKVENHGVGILDPITLGEYFRP